MEEARRRTDFLGDGGRERDHVVLGRPFDLFDAADVESGFRPQFPRGVDRHEAGVGHRVGRRELNVEPRLVAALLAPNRAHVRVCITGDHRAPPE